MTRSVRPAMRVKAPTKRYNRINAAWLSGTSPAEADMRPVVKRGPQKESLVGKANREWAALKGGVLRRNRRGMVDMPHGKMPIGLSEPLILDEIGYLTITVTPELLGRRIAVLMVIEDKTDTGVLADHQARCIEELRDAGAIAGVSRGPHDCEEILTRWRNGR